MDPCLVQQAWQLAQKEQNVRNAEGTSVGFCFGWGGEMVVWELELSSACQSEDYQENTKLASGYYSHLLKESN